MKSDNEITGIPLDESITDKLDYMKLLSCGHQGMFLSIPPDLSQFKDCHPDLHEAIFKNCNVHIKLDNTQQN